MTKKAWRARAQPGLVLVSQWAQVSLLSTSQSQPPLHGLIGGERSIAEIQANGRLRFSFTVDFVLVKDGASFC